MRTGTPHTHPPLPPGWSPILPCNRLFRFAWFIIAFGLVTLVGACVAAVPKYGLRSSRSFCE